MTQGLMLNWQQEQMLQQSLMVDKKGWYQCWWDTILSGTNHEK